MHLKAYKQHNTLCMCMNIYENNSITMNHMSMYATNPQVTFETVLPVSRLKQSQS